MTDVTAIYDSNVSNDGFTLRFHGSMQRITKIKFVNSAYCSFETMLLNWHIRCE